MTRLVFDVLSGPWTADGETYADSVVVDDASPELVRLASHAHAAGMLDVQEGLDLSDVQTQEDGEAAYADAQGDWVAGTDDEPGHWSGPWREGHDIQQAIDETNRKAK